MNPATIIEAVGYLGSALVLVSFLMSSVVKLRIVNTVGSLVFAVYALIIHSYPTAVMNFALVCINLHFLWKLRRKDPSYRLVTLKPEEGYVQDFLRQNAEDIRRFFPTRKPEDSEPNKAYMVFHKDQPAGIMIGSEIDAVLNVGLDYSTPAYRDCSVGAFLLENLKKPLRLRYGNAEQAHVPYLKKLGFQQQDDAWEIDLQEASE
ncbi:MAG: YgjV family protein [Oscillospiraceae bacterium]|nr:YgjV family protein [Oscillospiraceae bacterium]